MRCRAPLAAAGRDNGTIHLRDCFGKAAASTGTVSFCWYSQSRKPWSPSSTSWDLPLHVDRLTLVRYLADVEQEAHDATFFGRSARPVSPSQSFALPRRPAPISPPTISTYYQLRPDPARSSDQVEFQREFRQRLCHGILDPWPDRDGMVSLAVRRDGFVCAGLSFGSVGHRSADAFPAVHRADDPCDESVLHDAVVLYTGVENFRIIPETQLSPDAFARFVYEQDEPPAVPASLRKRACFDWFAATASRSSLGQGHEARWPGGAIPSGFG
ncbi:MAG: hypothetical protein U0787_23410 [Polyangia bacterium]